MNCFPDQASFRVSPAMPFFLTFYSITHGFDRPRMVMAGYRGQTGLPLGSEPQTAVDEKHIAGQGFIAVDVPHELGDLFRFDQPPDGHL